MSEPKEVWVNFDHDGAPLYAYRTEAEASDSGGPRFPVTRYALPQTDSAIAAAARLEGYRQALDDVDAEREVLARIKTNAAASGARYPDIDVVSELRSKLTADAKPEGGG